MKVEAIGIGLARRSMFEAADLGVRLVGANAGSVWRTFLPVHLAVCALALTSVPWGGGWPVFILIWLKPWLDRSLLFVLARAVFRQPTRLVDLLLARREVWWRDLLATLTLRRLSPWRSYVQPAQQLEGQRGAERRHRVAQILNHHGGTALAMQGAFATVESALAVGLLMLPSWFAIGDARGDWMGLFSAGPDPWSAAAQFTCYAVAVAVVEPFFVGAGFAMYLNRRVELEAWDIEQEFRVAFASS
ncbi:MAG: hypothetical protein ABI699_02485 [Caldimonas sp.]